MEKYGIEEGNEEKAENHAKINANRHLMSHFNVQRKSFIFFVTLEFITLVQWRTFQYLPTCFAIGTTSLVSVLR